MSIWTLGWLDFWAGGKLRKWPQRGNSFGPAERMKVLLSLQGNIRIEFRSLSLLSTVYKTTDCEESYSFTISIEFPCYLKWL